jgi:S-adenosylmethionine:tRNA ribosyltransferase-isomerase
VLTSDFDYNLPPERIAQTPVEPRHSSRLLVMNRQSGALEHKIFWDLPDFLLKDDLLVMNDTRVIPARIFAKKIPDGGKVELLLLKKQSELVWEALVGGKGLVKGKQVLTTDGLKASISEVLDGSKRVIEFSEPVESHLKKIGNVPLPPYIHETLADPERYQTIYSRQPGSAAAPTAGLHFSPELLARIKDLGVRLAYVDLHVGLDTFAPVTEEMADEHHIHTEWCELSQATADLINITRSNGGRVIAVGTTSVRTLESAASTFINGKIAPFQGPTSLFILPGYQFRIVDAMITNFHLPKSTLLMLVSAFAGREHILSAYQTAIKLKYRFFSFGDAMFIQ